MAFSASFSYINDILTINNDGNSTRARVRVYSPYTKPTTFETIVTINETGSSNVSVVLPSGYWAIKVEQLSGGSDILSSVRIPSTDGTYNKYGQTIQSLPASLSDDDDSGNVRIDVTLGWMWKIDTDSTTIDNKDDTYRVSGNKIYATVDPSSSFDANVVLKASVTIDTEEWDCSTTLSKTYTAGPVASEYITITVSVADSVGAYTLSYTDEYSKSQTLTSLKGGTVRMKKDTSFTVSGTAPGQYYSYPVRNSLTGTTNTGTGTLWSSTDPSTMNPGSGKTSGNLSIYASCKVKVDIDSGVSSYQVSYYNYANQLTKPTDKFSSDNDFIVYDGSQFTVIANSIVIKDGYELDTVNSSNSFSVNAGENKTITIATKEAAKYPYYIRDAIQELLISGGSPSNYSIPDTSYDSNTSYTKSSLTIGKLNSKYYIYQGYKSSLDGYPKADNGAAATNANTDDAVTLNKGKDTYITVYYRKKFNYTYKVVNSKGTNSSPNAIDGAQNYATLNLISLINDLWLDSGYAYESYKLGNGTTGTGTTVVLNHTTSSIGTSDQQYIIIYVRPKYQVTVNKYVKTWQDSTYQNTVVSKTLYQTNGSNFNLDQFATDGYEYVGYSSKSVTDGKESPDSTYTFSGSTTSIELNVYYDKIDYPYTYTKYKNGTKWGETSIINTYSKETFTLLSEIDGAYLYEYSVNGKSYSKNNKDITLVKNTQTAIKAYYGTPPSIVGVGGSNSPWEISFSPGATDDYSLEFEVYYNGTVRGTFSKTSLHGSDGTYSTPSAIPYKYTLKVKAIDAYGLESNTIEAKGAIAPGGQIEVKTQYPEKFKYKLQTIKPFSDIKVQYGFLTGSNTTVTSWQNAAHYLSSEIVLNQFYEHIFEERVKYNTILKYQIRIILTTESSDYWYYQDSDGNKKYYSYSGDESAIYELPPKYYSIKVTRDVERVQRVNFQYINDDNTTEYVSIDADQTITFYVPHGKEVKLTGVTPMLGYSGIEMTVNGVARNDSNFIDEFIEQPYEIYITYLSVIQSYDFKITFSDPISAVYLTNFYPVGATEPEAGITIAKNGEGYNTLFKADLNHQYIDLDIFYADIDSLYDFNTLTPTAGRFNVNVQKKTVSYNLAEITNIEIDLAINHYYFTLDIDTLAIESIDCEINNQTITLDWLETSVTSVEKTNKNLNSLFFSNCIYRAGFKKVFIYDRDNPDQKYYLNSSNFEFSIPENGWGIGKYYTISAEEIAKTVLDLTADKYSLTVYLSNIDEVFYNNLNRIVITDNSDNDKEIINTTFALSKSSYERTYTDIENPGYYLIKAGRNYTVDITLVDSSGQTNNNQHFYQGVITASRDNPTDISLTAGGRWIQAKIEGNYNDYHSAQVFYNGTLYAPSEAEAKINTVHDVNSKPITGLVLATSYNIKVCLEAIDGSGAIWEKTKTISTLSAYGVSFNLNGVAKIKVKSDIEPNGVEIADGGILSVSPDGQMEFMNAITYATIAPGTERLRNYTYTAPVTFVKQTSEGSSSGTLYNRNKSFNSSTHTINEDNITFTIRATPADWEWPSGYTKDKTPTGTPILTKGGPVSLFEYEAWNELMFYLNKWGQYLNKLYTNYENTLMTSENTTLTAAIYNHAYAQLNTLFTNLSDAIITNAVSTETSVTAKGLEDFGNAINYDNIKE